MKKKNKRLKIGCDIDDCVAAFSQGYLNRFGKFPAKDWCITRNVNNILIHEKAFWLGLPLLRKPDFTPTLFCSARVNNPRWTKQYLKQNGLEGRLYQVNGYFSSKVDVLKNKNIDVFIDDAPHHFKALNAAGIPCLLMNAEGNQDIETPLRIYTLNYEEIERVYNENFN